MARSKTTGPRQRARRALLSLGAALMLLSSASSSSHAAGTGDLKPFVGAWTGNWNPGPGSNGKFRALDLEIRADGKIVETWYRYRKNDDGTTRTEKTVRPVTRFEVSGQTLTLKSRVEKFPVPGRPQPVATEIEESLELKGPGAALFKSLSNSYLVEAKRRGDFIPPPPPPIAMKRVS